MFACVLWMYKTVGLEDQLGYNGVRFPGEVSQNSF